MGLECFVVWTLVVLLGVASGTALLLTGATVTRLVGLYILFALQVLGLATASTIPFARVPHYRDLVRRVQRKRTPQRTDRTSQREILAAVTTYGYSAFFFGSVGYFLNSVNLYSYSGAPDDQGLTSLFDFVYSNFICIVTLGYVDITPLSLLAKTIAMAKIGLGLLFNLLIFSLLVDRLAAAHQNRDR